MTCAIDKLLYSLTFASIGVLSMETTLKSTNLKLNPNFTVYLKNGDLNEL